MAWWQRAHVGQKVVCVDDGWDGGGTRPMPPRAPMQNEILTISRVLHLSEDIGPAGVYLLFAEIPEMQCVADGVFEKPSWFAPQFLPLETRDTEAQVARLRRLLTPAPRVPEEA